ncbi:unnamed protein product [Caenorhabditis sp. 36 PRJEB53466]|nr:unnamed protein product [Caenorhabditis sp. 36 PRJEB53466]
MNSNRFWLCRSEFNESSPRRRQVLPSESIDTFHKINQKCLPILVLGYDKDGWEKKGPLLVKDVIASTLKLVIEWCERHKDDDPALLEEQKKRPRSLRIPEWDKQFLARLDRNQLFDLISASHTLNIEGLMNIACKTLANMAKGKSTEEMRELFGIPEPWEQPSTSTATWD